MDYEKKYKEAFERAKVEQKTFFNLGNISAKTAIERIFPELKESEDEKIRKALIQYIKDKVSVILGWRKEELIAWLEKQKPNQLEEYVFRPYAGCSIESAAIQAVEQQKLGKKVVLAFNGAYIPVGGKAADDIIHEYDYWLEKQGETYPVLSNSSNIGKDAWSEEDKRILNKIQDHLREFYVDKKGYPYIADKNSQEMKEFQWLKSFKYRVQQPKQEWNEEDEIQLSEAIQMIEANGTWIRSEDAVKKVSNWLKSLKPNHWKPSEYDISLLEEIARNIRNNVRPFCSEVSSLENLINELKKL